LIDLDADTTEADTAAWLTLLIDHDTAADTVASDAVSTCHALADVEATISGDPEDG